MLFKKVIGLSVVQVLFKPAYTFSTKLGKRTWSIGHTGDHYVAIGQAVSRVGGGTLNFEQLRWFNHL